jgi:hypothetical protein
MKVGQANLRARTTAAASLPSAMRHASLNSPTLPRRCGAGYEWVTWLGDGLVAASRSFRTAEFKRRHGPGRRRCHHRLLMTTSRSQPSVSVGGARNPPPPPPPPPIEAFHERDGAVV